MIEIKRNRKFIILNFFRLFSQFSSRLEFLIQMYSVDYKTFDMEQSISFLQ